MNSPHLTLAAESKESHLPAFPPGPLGSHGRKVAKFCRLPLRQERDAGPRDVAPPKPSPSPRGCARPGRSQSPRRPPGRAMALISGDLLPAAASCAPLPTSPSPRVPLQSARSSPGPDHRPPPPRWSPPSGPQPPRTSSSGSPGASASSAAMSELTLDAPPRPGCSGGRGRGGGGLAAEAHPGNARGCRGARREGAGRAPRLRAWLGSGAGGWVGAGVAGLQTQGARLARAGVRVAGLRRGRARAGMVGG